jgi:hypothetical protein
MPSVPDSLEPGTNAVIYMLVGLFLGVLLPSYFREKGKNLATKEDIAEITKQVEAIRAEYSQQLQQQSHQDQRERDREGRLHAMRVAAIDRRLEAHQQAYALWRRLLVHVHDREKIGEVILESQDWWEHHCLYLDEEARQAFYLAYTSAGVHGDLLRAPRGPDSVAAIKANWQKIIGAGEVVVRGAALPPLVESEHRIVGVDQDSEGTAG